MQVTRSDRDRYIAVIRMHVPLVPTELIFNMNERSLSDWEERGPKRVLVPSDADDVQLYDHVHRRIRHQTFLCWVSASGDAGCPWLITSCRWARSMFENSTREDVDVKIEVRDYTDITAELFEWNVQEPFFPKVETNRERTSWAEKIEILLCDNYRADLLRKLAEHGILLITYPPPFHIFQILDTLLFGRLKAVKKHKPYDPDLNFRFDNITKIRLAYEIVTRCFTMRGSRKKTGSAYMKRD
jgi:hypothetical protein